MFKKINKNEVRKGRVARIREKVSGTPDRPRLCVNKSLSHIYAQLIDDVKGVTLASASTVQKDIASKINGKTKQEAAFVVGEALAKAAIKKGITTVVFDRAGYLYTGRVKQVAEGARNAGLKF